MKGGDNNLLQEVSSPEPSQTRSNSYCSRPIATLNIQTCTSMQHHLSERNVPTWEQLGIADQKEKQRISPNTTNNAHSRRITQCSIQKLELS